jgi:hypothetical protein
MTKWRTQPGACATAWSWSNRIGSCHQTSAMPACRVWCWSLSIVFRCEMVVLTYPPMFEQTLKLYIYDVYIYILLYYIFIIIYIYILLLIVSNWYPSIVSHNNPIWLGNIHILDKPFQSPIHIPTIHWWNPHCCCSNWIDSHQLVG